MEETTSRRVAVWAFGILLVVLIGWVAEIRLDRGEALPEPPPGMVIVRPQ